MRKPEKIFLNNTNLQYALKESFGHPIDIGTIRELMFIQTFVAAKIPIHFSEFGDYRVGDIIFEIGGKNKTRKQFKGMENTILVKDELVTLHQNTIPLLYFGFLY